jgi:nitrite reductase/ring-hydroxylating ferredoxin subunit
MADLVKVAKASELPTGSGKQVEVEGKGISVAVFNVDGGFYVIDGTCAHVGGPLGEGGLDGNVVTCPWHGWQYDVMTGNCGVKPGVKQKSYPVKVQGDDIFVEL